MALPQLSRQLLRFIVVGVVNTLGTGILVSLLSLFLIPWLAYTISYAVGIVFAFVASGKWVFSSKLSGIRALWFFLGYLVVFVIGLLTVLVINSLTSSPGASGLVVFVTAPLNFLVGRIIFYRPRSHTGVKND